MWVKHFDGDEYKRIVQVRESTPGVVEITTLVLAGLGVPVEGEPSDDKTVFYDAVDLAALLRANGWTPA